jgi:hypothetical protein
MLLMGMLMQKRAAQKIRQYNWTAQAFTACCQTARTKGSPVLPGPEPLASRQPHPIAYVKANKVSTLTLLTTGNFRAEKADVSPSGDLRAVIQGKPGI